MEGSPEIWSGCLKFKSPNNNTARQLHVRISLKHKSKNWPSSFGWSPDVKEVTLSRYPKSCLKKRNNLKPFIQQSTIVQLTSLKDDESLVELVSLLRGKFCGYIEPKVSDDPSIPIVLMLAENDLVIGFCVEGQNVEEGMDVTAFRKMWKENVTLCQDAWHLDANQSFSSTFTSPNTSFEERNSAKELRYVFEAEWIFRIFDEEIKYTSACVAATSTNEFHLILFKHWLHNLSKEELKNYKIVLRPIDETSGTLAHPTLPGNVNVTLIKDLSSLEENIFNMGDSSSEVFMVDFTILEELVRQFEVKHESQCMVVPKFECSPKKICTDISKMSVIDLIEKVRHLQESSEPEESDVASRTHYNPDEIIEGRPKWTKMTQMCPQMKSETSLDFDRLNPHRSFIPEFDDNFKNEEAQYQKVALKMMADLQCELFVPIGDAKIAPDVEEKAMAEYLKWEEYKKRNKREDEPTIVRRKKVEVKVKRLKCILPKNLRKDVVTFRASDFSKL